MSILGYKKEPGSRIWKAIYELTLKQVEKATRPRKNGLEDGSKNYPAADAQDFSETENRIVYEAENHLKTVDDMANKEFTDISRQAATLSLARLSDDFSDIELEAEKDINRHALESLPELKKARIEERKELRDLKLFKEQNNLRRLARYPSSRIWYISIIFVCWLVESLGNAFYFSLGSSLGLLGGYIQAMGISVINIAVSFAAGRIAIPYMHHINWVKKIIGGFFLGLWIGAISISHLLVAHYRDLLLIDPENAMTRVWEKFYAAPFRFESMDSWFVLMLGLVIAIVALIEGYKFDDPYPGYGKKARDYAKKLEALEKAENAARKSMLATVREAEKKVTSRLEEYDKKVRALEDLYMGASSVLDHFDNIYMHVDDIVCSAVKTYREANLSVRTDPAPACFERMPQVKRLLRKEQFQANLQDLKEVRDISFSRLAEIRDKAATVLKGLASKTEDLRGRIETLAKDAESMALEEIRKEEEGV